LLFDARVHEAVTLVRGQHARHGRIVLSDGPLDIVVEPDVLVGLEGLLLLNILVGVVLEVARAVEDRNLTVQPRIGVEA